MRISKQGQFIVIIVLAMVIWPSLCFSGFLKVGGSSMEPALKNGQRVWVSNYAKETDPARGDIIAFEAEKLTLLKRVIGLPKEKVVIKEGIIYIVNQENLQGEKLNEPYLSPETKTEPDGEFLVPDGQYFVLGDKRRASRDSRAISCIPREKVIGKVTKTF